MSKPGARSFVSERIADLPHVPSRAVAELPIELLPLQGAPVVPPPPYVVEAAERAAREPRMPPIRGLLRLREAIADALEAELGWRPDPASEIVVTNGSMQAISAVLAAVIDPGDEVLLPSPCFFYHQPVTIAGGVPVHVASDCEAAYRPDWNALSASATVRTKLIVANTPANPTGYVMTREDVEELAGLAERHDLVVVCDEAYDLLVYDGREHESPLGHAALRERAILLRSFTKSYALGPWRLGYAVAPAALADAVARAVGWMTLSVNHVSQAVGVAALEHPREWFAAVLASYGANRDRACAAVRAAERLHCHTPQGCAFLWLDLRDLGAPEVAVAERLAYQLGIPATPGEHFGGPGFARVPFGGLADTVVELTRRLALASV